MPSLADIAARFGGEIRGDGSLPVDGVGSLSAASKRQIAFFESAADSTAPGASPPSSRLLAECKAGAILLSSAAAADDSIVSALGGRAVWIAPGSPRLFFARLARWLCAEEGENKSAVSPRAEVAADAKVGKNADIAPMAVIESGATVGDNCRIGPGAVVGRRATLGAATTLMARAVVCGDSSLGEGCLIHSGAVIGADGFGFVGDENGAPVKIPQLGRARLGDNVEVGANAAIDRGALDDTVIGDNVKIDNLAQIGHNVRIGDNTIVCGCVGVAGSAIIGRGCLIGGGAGIAGHLTIGDGATIAARAEVTRSVAAGESVSSTMPARPVRQWRRFVGGLRRLTADDIRRSGSDFDNGKGEKK